MRPALGAALRQKGSCLILEIETDKAVAGWFLDDLGIPAFDHRSLYTGRLGSPFQLRQC
jgi:hypothetical protein